MTEIRELARALLSPESIALIGASADERKTTSRPQRYLRRHGFAGALYPVNPSRDQIFGEVAYGSPGELPSGIDHAHIMLPTERVIETVRACGEQGVKCASILAGGFAEAGEAGRSLQQELLGAAEKYGMRLLGPNCIGVINVTDGITISANAVLEMATLMPGRVGLVSQSGSLIGAILSRGQARGQGFSKLISVGNEADLKLGEVADLLVDDPATDIILLFLETIRDADRIALMTGRAVAAGKPVIAYRLGKSDLGAELATSHTGALAGNDAAIDAFLDDVGILRVDSFEGLLEMGALALGHKPRALSSRRRVAVLTTSGGGGAMVVDRLGLYGIDVPAPPEHLRQELRQADIEIGPDRLIDVTLAGARPEVYGGILRALMASDHVDAVVAVVGSSAQFHPELAVRPILDLKGQPKPLAVFLTPEADASLALLAQAGVAAFRTPESCADAVAAILRWRLSPKPQGLPAATVDQVAHRIFEHSGTEADALEVFRALGISIVRSQTIAGPDDRDAISSIDFFPVAVKVLSPDIAHKTEIGGVVLGIEDADSLCRASRNIVESVAQHAPAARIDGILVQAMATGVAECLVGFKRDPHVGPLAVVGIGGTLAELYGDVAVRCAPVSADIAIEMIESLQGAPLLRGFRGRPKGDIPALARAVAALSELARFTGANQVLEAEINPLIVKVQGDGVVAADGLIVKRP